MSTPYAAPGWRVPVAATPSVARVPFRNDVAMAALVIVYSALLGGAFGVLWPAVAPHVDLIRAASGSEAAATAVLGDDVWFLLLGIGAGLLSALVVLLAGGKLGRGPGAVIGLVAGGLLGSVIAAHLGHHIQQPKQAVDLKKQAPHITAGQVVLVLHYFGFRVRAYGVYLAWPIAAVVVVIGTVIARSLRGRSD